MEAKPKTVNIAVNRPLHQINIALEKVTDPKALKEVKIHKKALKKILSKKALQ